MKKLLTVFSVIAICGATSAFATDNMMMDNDHMKMMVDKHMKMMDTNGDGKISKEEYMTAMEKKFSTMDKNGDGMLTEQEIMDSKMMEMKDMEMMKQ